MDKLNPQLYARLTSLTRDELYDILKQSGVVFTVAKREDLAKDELLLVADEADLNILQFLLEKVASTKKRI